MKNFNKNDIEFLIDCLKKGKEIPLEYKYALFPTNQKEYELVYAGKMRKEDILADNEEAKAVPLQVEKIFNGKRKQAGKDWNNLLVFGDNLQILKTFYKDEDPLIKGNIKGKVKLIYIDPPFGTGDQYDANQGQSAYSARRKGADFVEFLRRRLTLLKEILADDGSIFVRLDYHFGHYIKVLMDEIFGKNHFRNDIIVKRTRTLKGEHKQFATATDSVFLYAKNKDLMNFNGFRKLKLESEWKWVEMHLPGLRKDESLLYRNIFNKKIKAPKGRRWALSQDAFNNAIDKGLVRMNKKTGLPQFLTKYETLGSNWTDISGYSKYYDYPTENSEKLLQRVIESCSQKDDLILDVFAGSGTTLAVAEKLGRRWVGCDIGKLAIYTIQKRLLEIDKSKNLENPKKKYSKPAKSFAVVASGLYDLGKIFALKKDGYINFVKRLFEIEGVKTKSISGVEIDGKKREFYVKIFPFWDLKDANVDEKYLAELHKNIGKKIDSRFYIIAPANNIDFISDYHTIGQVRYYFLKVPYQIIKELHKVQFKKLRQPQSKRNINDLDEAVGFHFIRQPEVKSEIKKLKDKNVLKIKRFESDYVQDETGEKLKNFESLAMVLVDFNYNGKEFMMDNYYFAEDIANNKYKIEFPKKSCGKNIMVIYVDIYGNEFKEIIKNF